MSEDERRSPEEQAVYEALIAKTSLSRTPLRWFGPIAAIGAVITAPWLIYAAFVAKGFWIALLALLLLVTCFRAGPALVFAVAATFLCFVLKQVGVWLPIAAYVVAAITLYLAVVVTRATNRMSP